MNPRRLYRSSTDRWIGGVAAGVADYFDVDPVIVRLVWIVAAVLTALIPAAIVYIVMLIVVPEEPGEWPAQSPWQPGGAPIGYAASYSATPGPTSSDPNQPAAATDPGAQATDPNATPGTTPDAGPTPPPGPIPPTSGWDWRWGNRQDRWQRRADRWQRRMDRWEDRREHRGSGGIVFGALLIVVGGLLAWHQIDPRLDLSLAWPVAIIAFGVFLVATSIEFHRGGQQ